MSARPRPLARCVLLAAALAGLAGAAVTGCREPAPPPARYTVRGLVKAISVEPLELDIHHEAIPEFVTRDGTKTGMASMSMPFGVLDRAALAGIEPGDRARITFEVRWDMRPATQIVAIEELPPDTPLELSGL